MNGYHCMANKPTENVLTEQQTEIAHMAALIASGYAARTGTALMRLPDIAKEAVMLATEIIGFVKKVTPS